MAAFRVTASILAAAVAVAAAAVLLFGREEPTAFGIYRAALLALPAVSLWIVLAILPFMLVLRRLSSHGLFMAVALSLCGAAAAGLLFVATGGNTLFGMIAGASVGAIWSVCNNDLFTLAERSARDRVSAP